MVFSGLPFLFFYLVVTLAVYKIAPLKLRNLILLLVSLFFYGWGEPVYILIMFLSIAVDYTHGMLVEKWRQNDRKARMAVASSVFFNLPVIFLKNTHFSSLSLLYILFSPLKTKNLGINISERIHARNICSAFIPLYFIKPNAANGTAPNMHIQESVSVSR